MESAKDREGKRVEEKDIVKKEKKVKKQKPKKDTMEKEVIQKKNDAKKKEMNEKIGKEKVEKAIENIGFEEKSFGWNMKQFFRRKLSRLDTKVRPSETFEEKPVPEKIRPGTSESSLKVTKFELVEITPDAVKNKLERQQNPADPENTKSGLEKSNSGIHPFIQKFPVTDFKTEVQQSQSIMDSWKESMRRKREAWKESVSLKKESPVYDKGHDDLLKLDLLKRQVSSIENRASDTVKSRYLRIEAQRVKEADEPEPSDDEIAVVLGVLSSLDKISAFHKESLSCPVKPQKQSNQVIYENVEDNLAEEDSDSVITIVENPEFKQVCPKNPERTEVQKTPSIFNSWKEIMSLKESVSPKNESSGFGKSDLRKSHASSVENWVTDSVQFRHQRVPHNVKKVIEPQLNDVETAELLKILSSLEKIKEDYKASLSRPDTPQKKNNLLTEESAEAEVDSLSDDDSVITVVENPGYIKDSSERTSESEWKSQDPVEIFSEELSIPCEPETDETQEQPEKGYLGIDWDHYEVDESDFYDDDGDNTEHKAEVQEVPIIMDSWPKSLGSKQCVSSKKESSGYDKRQDNLVKSQVSSIESWTSDPVEFRHQRIEPYMVKELKPSDDEIAEVLRILSSVDKIDADYKESLSMPVTPQRKTNLLTDETEADNPSAEDSVFTVVENPGGYKNETLKTQSESVRKSSEAEEFFSKNIAMKTSDEEHETGSEVNDVPPPVERTGNSCMGYFSRKFARCRKRIGSVWRRIRPSRRVNAAAAASQQPGPNGSEKTKPTRPALHSVAAATRM